MEQPRCPCCEQVVTLAFAESLRRLTADRERELFKQMSGPLPPPYRGTIGFHEEEDPETGRKRIYASRQEPEA